MRTSIQGPGNEVIEVQGVAGVRDGIRAPDVTDAGSAQPLHRDLGPGDDGPQPPGTAAPAGLGHQRGLDHDDGARALLGLLALVPEARRGARYPREDAS